jgi:DNA-binding ferritin-like protein
MRENEGLLTFYSLLVYYSHNLHILHWKISGIDFGPHHKYLDELYSTVTEHIDTVGEMLLQYWTNPLTLREVVQLLDESDLEVIEVSSHVDFTSAEVMVIARKMLQELSQLCEKVADDGSLQRGHQSDLDSLQSWYSKQSRYIIERHIM